MMVAIFLLVVGALGMAAGLNAISTSRKVRRWPVVTGQIVERGTGPATTTGASRPGRYFEPVVKYTYAVDGKRYTGQRIGLTHAAYDEATAKRVADKLPEAVEVHYNPGDPGDACLQPSALGFGLVLVIAGGLGALVGAGMLLVRLLDRS